MIKVINNVKNVPIPVNAVERPSHFALVEYSKRVETCLNEKEFRCEVTITLVYHEKGLNYLSSLDDDNLKLIVQNCLESQQTKNGKLN